MGEGFVQNSGGRLAKTTIQRQSQFITSLEISTSLIAMYKQEEPCEWRLSRTVP